MRPSRRMYAARAMVLRGAANVPAGVVRDLRHGHARARRGAGLDRNPCACGQRAFMAGALIRLVRLTPSRTCRAPVSWPYGGVHVVRALSASPAFAALAVSLRSSEMSFLHDAAGTSWPGPACRHDVTNPSAVTRARGADLDLNFYDCGREPDVVLIRLIASRVGLTPSPTCRDLVRWSPERGCGQRWQTKSRSVPVSSPLRTKERMLCARKKHRQ